MPKHEDNREDLLAKIELLRLRLHDAEETLDAIRNGQIDGLVVSGPGGDQVYTLTGANRIYRVLFETMNEGAAALGSDGTVFFCNTKLSAMLKTRMEIILGASIFRFVTAADTGLVKALLESGLEKPQKMEISLTSQDGNPFPCHVSTSPFSVEDSSAICMIVADITERKQAEEDLIRSNKDLHQFAYVASHDLQEPLRNVVSCLQMLEKKYKGNLDADADRYISYAIESALRMKGLIQDLLEFSRIGTKGKSPRPTDCEQILDRTLKNLRSAISEVGAVITHDPLPTVPADDTQLLQVFQNLIQNAIKFRGDDPPRVHVSAVKNKNEWIFSVEDNGIGIESQYLDRIFEIFQRLNTRAEYEGTGMGLAIVKKVVARHHGRVWVESEPGKGTTFYFAIPAKGMRT